MARATFNDYRRLITGGMRMLTPSAVSCINGFALGRKHVHGKPTSDLAVQVFVSRKLPTRRLALANRIPERIRLPDENAPGGVLEFTTDVQEASFSSDAYTDKMRPAPSGISIAHTAVSAGTLGGLVRDKDTGDTVILSNNHVLANSNDASPGDAILQPGPSDGGTDPADCIATLTRFVPIEFDESDKPAANLVDAAIATPTDSDLVTWDTLDIGENTPAEFRNLTADDLGDFVHKTGRTTEHTQGYVQALFATVRVKYSFGQYATFINQIICSQNPSEEPFSDGGDSGSLVYDAKNRCVGLLFAGSAGSESDPATTILNPINAVCSQLNIEALTPPS